MQTIPVHIFKQVSLQEMLEKQEDHRAKILEGKASNELWLVEHKPTLSLGRAEKGENILFPKEFMEAQGFEVAEMNRGGKVTYHGPGQLVAYPIVNISQYHMGVKQYVAALEDCMTELLLAYNLPFEKKEGMPGVWCNGKKIGSIGIHLRKHVSIHGLALNICPDMNHFNYITPCGIADVKMTSFAKEGVDINLDEAFSQFTQIFNRIFVGKF